MACDVFISYKSDTIWELMEAQARRGFSHANFALHTKYYRESSKFLISYDYVRKAAANLKDSYAEICTEHELPIQHALSVTENMPPSEYFTRLAPNICKMFLQLKHAGLLEKYSLGFSDEKLLDVLERDDSDQARPIRRRLPTVHSSRRSPAGRSDGPGR